MNVTPAQIQAAAEGKIVELSVNGHCLYLLNRDAFDRTKLGEEDNEAREPTNDPVAIKAACDRMDAMREANGRRFGVQDIGVDIIREMRDSR